MASAEPRRGGGLQIVRAEFLKGQNRPIVGSPMRPYVMVRETSNESVSEDSPGVSSSQVISGATGGTPVALTDPRVTYRWRRGPKVGSCVFHPQRPGVIRDIARTFLFYCSSDCLAMGYRRLPAQHCLPRPKPEEDDLQYCPYGPGVGGGGGRVTTWKVVSVEAVYVPKADDRDCLFAVDISAGQSRMTLMTGPCFDPETYSPPLREMLSVFGGAEQFPLTMAIKLLNWNVLADIYATEQQFEYCPGWALSWDYRKHLILKQIAAIDADLVCLQEVQSDHFETDLLPALKMFGFGHIYAAKTKGLFTNKYTSEGCCVLYRLSRFQKLEHFVLEFDKQAHERTTALSGESAADTNARLNRLSRGNVALLVLLEDLRHGRRPLGVVTTHVTADVDAGDVKLWQTQCLLENIQQWASPLRHGGPLPLVLCGDFNSTPDSPVYELLTTGQVVQGHVEDPYTLLATGLGHNMPLRSSHVSVVGHEAPVTNYTLRFSGTLDYVMFSSNTLRAMAVSNALSYEELNRDVALPSPTQPSDHLLSVAVFTYI